MYLNKKFRTIVIEDIPASRKELVSALNESHEFVVVGEASEPEQALLLILEHLPDVLFLDIELNEGDAFQLIKRMRRTIPQLPAIIINTTHRDFDYVTRIHNEFGDCVVHILQKPFWSNWDEKEEVIVNKILQFYDQRKPQPESAGAKMSTIRIKVGGNELYINPSEIILIETKEKGKGGVNIILSQRSYDAGLALKYMLEILPSDFAQINRNQIINIQWVSAFDLNTREILAKNGETYSLSDNYRDEFIKHFN